MNIRIIIIGMLALLSKGQANTAYFSEKNFTWQDAKAFCPMVGLENKIYGPVEDKQLAWINVSVEFTSWVEYIGCYEIKDKEIKNVSNVDQGKQLLQCLQNYKDCSFIGLQQRRCACLKNLTISSVTVDRVLSLDQTESCNGDENARCAKNITLNTFVLYKLVGIDNSTTAGNCLSVTIMGDGRQIIQANHNCTSQFHPICSDSNSKDDKITIQNVTDQKTSHRKCSPRGLASYHTIKGMRLNITRGRYWLSNIRREILLYPPAKNPNYCIAVKLRPGDDGNVFTQSYSCSTLFPALCYFQTESGTYSSNIQDIVIITVIAGTIMIVIVIVITVVLCKRKRNTPVTPPNQPMAIVGTGVFYAEVNKPAVKREKSTASQRTQPTASDDTYDHMEHCRLSQTHNPTDCNYDTMHSMMNAGEEENNYDHVTETKKESKQIVVDISADYSHVEHREIQDILLE